MELCHLGDLRTYLRANSSRFVNELVASAASEQQDDYLQPDSRQMSYKYMVSQGKSIALRERDKAREKER